MATAGPLFTGTGANFNDGGTTVWSNPTNIQGDTANAATCQIGTNGGTSQRLRASNFGFTIPTGSTINGITVEAEQTSANNSRQYWNSVQLLIGGAESGDDLSDGSAIQSGVTYKTFGGSTSLWGLTPSVAQINATGFGVSLKIGRSSAQATTTSISRVRITVDYSIPITTETGSVSADAILLATQAAALSIDAIALVSVVDSFGADSEIEEGVSSAAVWTDPADLVLIQDFTPTLAFMSPVSTNDMYFEMQLDTVDTFDSPDLRVYRSYPTADGWEYDDGGWQALPLPLPAADTGSEVRFTIPTPLDAGVWFRRVRASI